MVSPDGVPTTKPEVLDQVNFLIFSQLVIVIQFFQFASVL